MSLLSSIVVVEVVVWTPIVIYWGLEVLKELKRIADAQETIATTPLEWRDAPEEPKPSGTKLADLQAAAVELVQRAWTPSGEDLEDAEATELAKVDVAPYLKGKK